MSHNPQQSVTGGGAYDPLPLTGGEGHQPRFMGQYDAAASSSQQSLQAPSEYGSAHRLNDANDVNAAPYRDDPNAVPMSPLGASAAAMNEKSGGGGGSGGEGGRSRRKMVIIGAIVALIIIILAIILPVYFTVIKKDDNDSAGGGDRDSSNADEGKDGSGTARPSGSGSPEPDVELPPVTGGDGSIITMEDGTTFTYRNPFGGYWYYDPNDPFNNGARAQSWTPALNETFNYGVDRIRGVNVGGWLVTEPFISPALYERYLNDPAGPAIDEYDLSLRMRADTANGGINQLEEHYRTFITEKDFADIAGAGLNYVRIPIGWWAVETRGDEPHLEGVSWNYFLKAIKWARKYGLRINLDLHAVPGSQNAWNHSGKFGSIGFLHGPMGYANAQRTLDIIRVLAEFISQPQYRDVVTMFGILNEPLGDPMGFDALARFYMEAYTIIRRAGGIGEGNGPWVSLHDGFFGRDRWSGVFPNADRLALDVHPYLGFGSQSSAPMSSYADTPCRAWGRLVNNSMAAFGLTTAGEWSNAVNDCGLYLNGVNLGTRYEGTYTPGSWPRVGDCRDWTDWTRYTPELKREIRQFTLASMDALQHFFFWTWRIGDSLASGRVETPAWSYVLGLQEGWMPTDPRDADGVCNNIAPWTPPLSVGSGAIPASVTSALSWPPPAISNGGPIEVLPSYTQTGAIPTLTATPVEAAPGETITRTVDVGSGWNNPEDSEGYVAEVEGCSYLDPWVTPAAAPPSPLCVGVARRGMLGRGVVEARATPAP
ncbi:exo-beta-1,3-glucanase [Coprinopsis cinerea AmutBmut pab1-1]|nr:exo-beta-1,3-glucanase [Coprinopsis cinerea AmutBmut pab1-1]